MMKGRESEHRQRGFTIVELMVATAVFAVLLIVVTVGILQISRVYYKGVTESNTQNTARSIADTVSQAIQFSGGTVTTTDPNPVPGSTYAFCVGNEQFSYTTGYQLKDDPDSGLHQSHHALVQDTIAGCEGAGPQNVRQSSVNGRELLAPNMRLSKLDVTTIGDNLYRVDVRVVYGDDDLLFSPSDPGNPQGDIMPDASCVGVAAGTQFCAVSELSTVVAKRVQ